MSLRVLGILIALALFGIGCSDPVDTEGAAEPSASDGSEPSDSDEDASAEAPTPTDFCAAAEAFINDRSVTDVASFNQEFFASVDARLSGLVDTAPSEIRGDLEALRAGFAETDEIFAEFDYEVTDERLGPALIEVDNESMLDATDNLQRYLQQSCELEPIGSLNPEQVDDIMDAFGVDRALAECLNLELGDIANIDSEELTPELMGRQVCGTSLLAVLTGGAGTT